MKTGIIVKAISGFYYVSTDNTVVECKARGKFRLDGTLPLVGDIVEYSVDEQGKGRIECVTCRRNWFIRPAVANVDLLVFVAANTNPITDPFLIDRVSVITEEANCELAICLNKSDIDTADNLYCIYDKLHYPVVRTSAVTGEGLTELFEIIRGKTCAFTGNSGVGKSSLLNALSPQCNAEIGEVSTKLGRGKHTTRHVELYEIGESTFIADTPGFASFDVEMINSIEKDNIQYDFTEFRPFIGKCKFNDCVHLKEPGCAVIQAVDSGIISNSRHNSYRRLYDLSSKHRSWKDKTK